MKYFIYTILLLPLLLTSCDQAKQLKEKLDSTKDSTTPVTQTEGLHQDWFEGRIVAKQDLSNSVGGLLTETIEYTIGRNQIKRELHRGGLNKLTKELSGIIVDLDKKSVLLYQSNRLDEYYCQLSLDEYKAYVLGEKDGEQEQERLASPGYGTVFLLTPPTPTYTSKNKAAGRKVADLNCDVVDIYFRGEYVNRDAYKLEVTHCPEIKVNRKLVELTEPNIPKEVTGFPCIYNLYLLSTAQKKDSTTDKTSRTLIQLLDKATQLLSEMKQEIESIERNPISASEFSLPESYKQVASLGELNAHFPTGGGDD